MLRDEQFAARETRHSVQSTTAVPTSSSQIKLCPRCQGHRIEKVLYNNGTVVLEQNCAMCDGEGVLVAPAGQVPQHAEA